MCGNARVEKADGFNYQTWTFKMKMLLGQKDCWGAVEGTGQAEEYTLLAFSYMALALHDDQIVHMKNEPTGKEV